MHAGNVHSLRRKRRVAYTHVHTYTRTHIDKRGVIDSGNEEGDVHSSFFTIGPYSWFMAEQSGMLNS